METLPESSGTEYDGFPTSRCRPTIVSLSATRPAALSDSALILLFVDAAQRAMCTAREITAVGMVIDAEPTSLDVLETSLRELLRRHGAELASITVRRI